MATDMRQRLLDAAQALVLERGFAATTVDAILAASGASKGAFFHHFRSKVDLGRALVERYGEQDAAVLDEAMQTAEAASDDPAEQLVALVRHFEEAADAAVAIQPSCLFVSFIYERQLAGAETADVVRRSVLHWRDQIRSKLELAAATRPTVAALDLDALADLWFTTFEGAYLLAGALDDRGRMRAQLAHLRRYLELLFGLSDDVGTPRRRRRR